MQIGLADNYRWGGIMVLLRILLATVLAGAWMFASAQQQSPGRESGVGSRLEPGAGLETIRNTGTDSTNAVQELINGPSRILFVPSAHSVGDLSISKDLHAGGTGYLIGRPTKGDKPTIAQLMKADTAGRLALLQAYYASTITLSRSVTIRGNLDLRDVLIRSRDGATLTVTGELRLANVALHRVQLQANGKGFIDGVDLISSDSPAVGLYATRGGTITAPRAAIIGARARGAMVQYGGVIDASGAHVSYSGSQGLYILFGGTIILARGTLEKNGSHGALINYGGAIDVSNSITRDNRGGGIVAESNGAIYAENATIARNQDAGISTSYGGVVNAEGATIVGNNSYAAYANGSGFINLRNATIDGTNNAPRNGSVLRAIGNGFIFSEKPGVGPGKTSLSADSYYPGFNTIGNGSAYVGTAAQNDSIVSIGGLKTSIPAPIAVKAGVVQATSLQLVIDTEQSAPLSDLTAINLSSPVDVVLLRTASDARAIRIRHNVGNIVLKNGQDITLKTRNEVVMLVKLHTKWVQP
jgi:hypothetical protein